ncbi:probable cytochrome P450 9f2 [Chironomus tepperi]|uniref:probable cytochrome P450 9f2 n=1 Tax=Chironomus tepperi TaxID=113505 RepID=UPI00391EE474
MLLFITLLVVLVYVIYKWSTSTYDFFEKQGIPYRQPLPLFGTNINMLLKKKPFIDVLKEWYNEFENEKLSGLFEFRRPVVLIRDPQIIKQLTIKDFDHFMDHRVLITEDIDPLFGKNLVSLTGDKWKDMRATLSPAFTGSKMRQMFDFVSTVAIESAEILKNDIQNGGETNFEFKDFASKFTCDNIASCAFGIEVNSFKNPKNDFYRIAKNVMNFSSPLMGLKLVGYFTSPKLMKTLGISLLDKEGCDFFQGALIDTMRTREKLGIVRKDMIHLMLEAKKGKLVHSSEESNNDGYATVEESHVGKSKVSRQWEELDLAAQCFIFFLAGFDTVAQTMSFVAYELACNPDIQQRLYEEILQTASETGDDQKINYEQLQSMKYLDQVISETLRKWPAAPMTDRLCTKDFELKYDNKVMRFEKNVNSILVPIWMLHRNPKYFPNPEKFDPERFNDENKHKIQDFTYLPFGAGPRNCIGSRFALMEVKTIFFYLLLNFSIEVTEKTQIPLKFENLPFQIKPEKGIWVELKPRV